MIKKGGSSQGYMWRGHIWRRIWNWIYWLSNRFDPWWTQATGACQSLPTSKFKLVKLICAKTAYIIFSGTKDHFQESSFISQSFPFTSIVTSLFNFYLEGSHYIKKLCSSEFHLLESKWNLDGFRQYFDLILDFW